MNKIFAWIACCIALSLGAASLSAAPVQAARASNGSYAFVYVPASRTFAVHMDKLAGDRAKAWWVNPRTGAATLIGEFAHSGASVKEFTPPDAGENVDWVLVIENAVSHFAAPAGRQSGKQN